MQITEIVHQLVLCVAWFDPRLVTKTLCHMLRTVVTKAHLDPAVYSPILLDGLPPPAHLEVELTDAQSKQEFRF